MRLTKGNLQVKKRIKNNQKGYTLIELIVTFVLLGLLVAAAASVLSPFMRLHLNQTNIAHAQTLSDILLSKISGQLIDAEKILDSSSEDYIQFINEDNELVTIATLQTFMNSSLDIDSETQKLLEDGTLKKTILNIDYASVEIGPDGELLTKTNNSDWYYGVSTYQSNEISNLTFNYNSTRKTVKITLQLKNIKTGYEYETSKIVKCINLKD